MCCNEGHLLRRREQFFITNICERSPRNQHFFYPDYNILRVGLKSLGNTYFMMTSNVSSKVHDKQNSTKTSMENHTLTMQGIVSYKLEDNDNLITGLSKLEGYTSVIEERETVMKCLMSI